MLSLVLGSIFKLANHGFTANTQILALVYIQTQGYRFQRTQLIVTPTVWWDG